jgi:hypothetical protein
MSWILGESGVTENIFKLLTYFSVKDENKKQILYAVANASRIINVYNVADARHFQRHYDDAREVEEAISYDIDASHWLKSSDVSCGRNCSPIKRSCVAIARKRAETHTQFFHSPHI